MEKNKVIVKIRNKEYIIMSADPQEYILSVANELDGRIKEIASANSALNPERLIILASLNLCDEYMKLSETNKALQQQITNCTNELDKYKNINGAYVEDEELKSELETAKEQIKLLEQKLLDDDSQRKEFDELKNQINSLMNEKNTMKEKYEKEIADMKKQFAEKESEWLEMIDKM